MKNPIVTFEVENYGEIKAELYYDIAPNTVKSFVSLINKGFYNGLSFHRVIDGFVIQGGCPKGNGTGGPGYNIFGEFKQNGFKNDLVHTFGVLSMARAMQNNSGGSQFFIMLGNHTHLDGAYTGFGKVISGDETVRAIGSVKVGMNDMPREKVVMTKVTVDTFGEQIPEPDKM